MSSGSLTRTLGETLALFDAGGTPRTTTEVADRLDVGRRSAYDRLDRLVERGELATKKVGASARVWWRPAPAAGVEDGDRTGTGNGPGGRPPGDHRLGTDAFVESLFDNQRDLVFALDADGEFAGWNDRVREVTGLDDDRIAARNPVEFVAADAADAAAAAVERVLEGGEHVTVELPLVTADGDAVPYEFTGSPIVDDGTVVGLTGVGRDVSERTRTRSRIERRRDELAVELREVFDRVDDAFFALDEDCRFTNVTEQAAALLDRSVGDLLGEHVLDALPGAADTAFHRQCERAVETRETVTVEEYYEPLATWFEVTAYPSASGLSVYFRDVTERTERERELERYERIVSTIDDGVYVLDEDFRFVRVNDAYVEMTGYDRDELLGEHCSLVVDEAVAAESAALLEEVIEGEARSGVIEADIHRADGSRLRAESRFTALPADGDGTRRKVGVVRDVSERAARERELELYETIVETVDDGIYAVDDEERFVLANEAYADLVGRDREELIGAPASTYYDEAHAPVVAERAADVREGERDVATIEFELTGGDGRTVPVETRYRPFPYGDGHGRCGVVRDVSDRIRRERELERQREKLAALNNLNRVVHETTDAVVAQSTRAEIEATVCEHLAGSGSYACAWIGDVDPSAGAVEVRASAGVEGSVVGATIPVDPADERRAGPSARAVRSGETRTVRGAEAAVPGPLAAHVPVAAVRSAAAIPVAHDGTVYGVLTVYADRPRAFDGPEGAVVEQLGEVVGHAIAATERKQALMSDELVELGFEVPDVFDVLGVDGDTAGTIRFDHVVPVGGGEYLVYGRTTPGAVAGLRALVREQSGWEEVTVREGDEGSRFEARLSDQPVLSTVASVGGSVERAVIEGGDLRMTVHVSPSVDVRRITDAVETTFPPVRLVTRRQITRPGDAVADAARAPEADLTDRQRTTLEAAYYAGFFEWPRDASGEEVAGSLGIAPPTFHQHLRKAQRKVVGQFLAAD